ncbi:MAG: hypothetical protein E6G22_01225 [Actinobacteria bacterium]|nr:MAG: hypothetical protein E6G22_01225 [Actinomycetota bacterium]
MKGAVAAGLGLGFLTAAQVGPIWLLCLRSTLRGGFRVGVAIGAGAAVIDMVYAGLGVAGASRLLEIDPLRVTLGVTGAVVLALVGLRTLWSAFRIRLGGEVEEEVASPRRAFVASLGATASNPMTIAAWAAIFTAAGRRYCRPAARRRDRRRVGARDRRLRRRARPADPQLALPLTTVLSSRH